MQRHCFAKLVQGSQADPTAQRLFVAAAESGPRHHVRQNGPGTHAGTATQSLHTTVPMTRLTWCRVGRLWGSTRGSGLEPVVKQVAQSAQALADVLQGY